MKLVQILNKVWAGWFKGAKNVQQLATGQLQYELGNRGIQQTSRVFPLAEDFETACINYEEFQNYRRGLNQVDKAEKVPQFNMYNIDAEFEKQTQQMIQNLAEFNIHPNCPLLLAHELVYRNNLIMELWEQISNLDLKYKIQGRNHYVHKKPLLEETILKVLKKDIALSILSQPDTAIMQNAKGQLMLKNNQEITLLPGSEKCGYPKTRNRLVKSFPNQITFDNLIQYLDEYGELSINNFSFVPTPEDVELSKEWLDNTHSETHILLGVEVPVYQQIGSKK